MKKIKYQGNNDTIHCQGVSPFSKLKKSFGTGVGQALLPLEPLCQLKPPFDLVGPPHERC
jgi:hypothetical protein